MSATTELAPDVVMTSRALELLTCFQDEFDDLVAKIAEDYARRRVAKNAGAPAVIEVGVDDVKAAAEHLMTLVKGLAASETLPAEVRGKIQDLNDCLNCNAD